MSTTKFPPSYGVPSCAVSGSTLRVSLDRAPPHGIGERLAGRCRGLRGRCRTGWQPNTARAGMLGGVQLLRAHRPAQRALPVSEVVADEVRVHGRVSAVLLHVPELLADAALVHGCR